jgi:RimJ/RimL family protein N-acetyltransferase
MPRLVEAALRADVLSRRPPERVIGDGVVLRPWLPTDAAAVRAAYAEPDIQRWHRRRIDDDAEAEAWVALWLARWRAGTDAGWAVTLPADDEALGYVALRDLDPALGSAHLRFWVRPPARGGGLARRAAATAARWGFTELGLHRVSLLHSVQNVPSCAVATGAGFRPEGTMRGYLQHADGWHDVHVHGRLATD